MTVIPTEFTKSGNVDHRGQHHDMSDQTVQYGTAGFRMHASKLPYIVFRMGALAALRSQSCNGQGIGIMITASHNAEQDNGVKIIDPMGEMLIQEWELAATELANASDSDYSNIVDSIGKKFVKDGQAKSIIHLGHDTRSSCAHLLKAAIAGANSITGGIVSCREHGLVTTPILHYLVRTQNDSDFGECSIDGYFKKLAKNFIYLMKQIPPVQIDEATWIGDDSNDVNADNHPDPEMNIREEKFILAPLNVDCANGVGTMSMQKLIKMLNEDFNTGNCLEGWDLKNFNTSSNPQDRLNENCGADFVKIKRTFPEGVEVKPGEKWASLDGDADRLVYFFKNDDGSFELLDGDAIIVLLVEYLTPLVKTLNDMNVSDPEKSKRSPLQIGVVQTAYANGASTAYLREKCGVEVIMVPTGVKHLHKAAHENFDIGVYFEANGHGTVLFSAKAKQLIRETMKCEDETIQEIANMLNAFANLINETVGDALSDLLAVEAVLALTHRKNLSEWRSTYNDLPSVQLKVMVPDRTLIKTVWNETRTTEPFGLQQTIDELLADVGNKWARAFVRPSGTEDIVRIYAECNFLEQARKLAEKLEAAVKHYCKQ